MKSLLTDRPDTAKIRMKNILVVTIRNHKKETVMKQKSVMLALVFASILALVGVAQIFAQGPNPRNPRAPRALAGTAFTYQGQLKDNGAPANGAYDFQFALFDAASGGTQIGATLNSNDVTVTNGYFTTPLDFGANAFTGDARYLEIAVRPGASSGAYTPLTPRQALTPAPYALALPGLYTQQNATSPNLIGGHISNTVTSGVYGATISGGGENALANRVTDNYGTIGGGYNNQAGDNTGSISDKAFATIGGGGNNTAGWYATVGGGYSNDASGSDATIGGGYNNTASLQHTTVAGGYQNVASADSATVGGGSLNNATGNYSTVGGGHTNNVSAHYATVPGGAYAAATQYGQMAFASGRFDTTGDAQTSTFVLRNTTADATPTELFLNGFTTRLTIATNRVLTFDILVVGVNVNNGNAAGYRLAGVIKNIGGTTSFIGTPNQVILGEDAAGWDATVVADNTNDALVVQVTGVPTANIRWVATVRTVEVAN
jgi:hypothetical protein